MKKTTVLPPEYSKEGLYFEAKSAPRGVPADFWETYSAFANTFGGTIVLGLSEDEDRNLIVTGVETPEKTVQTLWDNLNNTRFTNYNILSSTDINIEEIEGRKIIVVRVPAAERHRRPIYIRNNINSGTFKRNNEGDYHCRLDEIKEMIRESEDISRDTEPIEELGIDCLDEETINRFLQEVNARRPGHPWARLPKEEFLTLSGAAATIGGGLHPTSAGLLMFGKIACIRRAFNDYFLDYRECLDEERWSYRIHSNSGEWSGNIYDFVSMVMDRLSARLGTRFKLEGYSNTGGSDTFISVREAVINGLIHADYHLPGGVTVLSSHRSISITNPGTMRVHADIALRGGHSDPRNVTLMALAMAVGWTERIGSGLYFINLAEEKGALQALNISEGTCPSKVKVKLTLPGFEDSGKDGERLLSILRGNPQMTRQELAERMGISLSSVSNLLTVLKAAGRVERVGSRKTGQWKVND